RDSAFDARDGRLRAPTSDRQAGYLAVEALPTTISLTQRLRQLRQFRLQAVEFVLRRLRRLTGPLPLVTELADAVDEPLDVRIHGGRASADVRLSGLHLPHGRAELRPVRSRQVHVIAGAFNAPLKIAKEARVLLRRQPPAVELALQLFEAVSQT